MILVTGGTGLVGSHLLFDLCKSGEKVRAIMRSKGTDEEVKKVFAYYSPDVDELFKTIEWVEADLLDVYSLMDAMEGVTEVFHCAATVSFQAKHEEEMMLVNVEGTANMVNAALEKGVKKFIHISSVATIGVPESGKQATEETFWKSSPENSNYAISKYGAEREVWRAANEGLDVVVVNPSVIIGAGNWQKSSSNLFSKGHKGIPYYTDGGSGFVDVRDVSALLILLMRSEIKNERFIISGENMKFKTFFDLMHIEFGKPKPNIKAGKFLSGFAWRTEKIRCFINGRAPLITKETARAANKINYYSNQKISKKFPDFKFISVERSIKDTCALFLKGKL